MISSCMSHPLWIYPSNGTWSIKRVTRLLSTRVKLCKVVWFPWYLQCLCFHVVTPGYATKGQFCFFIHRRLCLVSLVVSLHKLVHIAPQARVNDLCIFFFANNAARFFSSHIQVLSRTCVPEILEDLDGMGFRVNLKRPCKRSQRISAVDVPRPKKPLATTSGLGSSSQISSPKWHCTKTHKVSVSCPRDVQDCHGRSYSVASSVCKCQRRS